MSERVFAYAGKSIHEVADDAFVAAYAGLSAEDVLVRYRKDIISHARKGYAYDTITSMINAQSGGQAVTSGQIQGVWHAHARKNPSEAKQRQTALAETLS